jgi:adenylate cyclase
MNAKPPPGAATKHPLSLWERRCGLIGAGLFLTLLVALLMTCKPLIVRQAELRIYDLMVAGRLTPPVSDLPVLIGIDDASLNVYGQWPWPRYRTAMLVEKLYEQGAKVVALDFLMPEPDRTSYEVIAAERLRDKRRPDRGGSAAPPAAELVDGNSLRLAEAIGKGSTVLGFYLDFDGAGCFRAQAAPSVPEGMIITGGNVAIPLFPHPVGIVRSLGSLTGAASAEGFTNAKHDCDGALRRVPLLLPYADGGLYPSLALASLLLASSDRKLTLARESAETTLLWGERRIPLDDAGNLLLDFRDAKKTFAYYSARSVLGGELAPGKLKGRIVLVGAWARGLGDYHLVPSGKSVIGLSIHATIIDNILSGRFIARPGWAVGAELFAVLLLGAASSWLLSKPGYLFSLVTVALGSVCCFWGARELLVYKGLYLSPLLPMLTPIVVMTFLGLLKYGIEARKVRQRNRDLIEAQDTVILSMSVLTATRDKETGGHILRTRRYVEILARQIAALPAYAELDENAIELLTKSAPLHDIGKVGIPDSILNKPGKLTAEEYEIMKQHTVIGAKALSQTISASAHPENNDFLHYAQDMIKSHHERWDGGGYPYGLKGEDIPVAGRLMALADVYDALTCQRVYKPPFSHEKAMTIIREDAGRGFDPDVVSAFIAMNSEFARIAREFSDEATGTTNVP